MKEIPKLWLKVSTSLDKMAAISHTCVSDILCQNYVLVVGEYEFRNLYSLQPIVPAIISHMVIIYSRTSRPLHFKLKTLNCSPVTLGKFDLHQYVISPTILLNFNMSANLYGFLSLFLTYMIVV